MRIENHPGRHTMGANAVTPTMTGKRFQHTIRTLGFTKRGAAHFVGVTERTMQRWIEEDHVPRPVSMVLELMIAKDLAPEEVLTIAGVRPSQINFIMKHLRDNRRAGDE
jgi:DNA-binding XRE family transcriptional regulator